MNDRHASILVICISIVVALFIVFVICPWLALLGWNALREVWPNLPVINLRQMILIMIGIQAITPTTHIKTDKHLKDEDEDF